MLEAIILQAREPLELFGVEIIDTEDFLELLVRYVFNMVTVTILAYGFYYLITRRKDYLFSFILVSTVVFLLCFLLENVKLQIGLALGLFAIFGIIRYRTNPIPIREMTYLFVVIGVSVINALANKKVSYAELVATNLFVILTAFILERVWLLNREYRKTINYEKIEMIKPEKKDELLADLKNRTGLNIHRIEVGRVDFLRDTARIRIYYTNGDHASFDEEEPLNEDDDE